MPTLLEVLKGLEDLRSQAGRGALAVLTLVPAAPALLEEVPPAGKAVSDCAVTGPLRSAFSTCATSQWTRTDFTDAGLARL